MSEDHSRKREREEALAKRIGALIDHELSEVERRDLEAQLFRNKQSRDLFRNFSADQALLQQAFSLSDSPKTQNRLESSILAEFDALEKTADRAFPKIHVAWQAAAAVFLIAGTFGLTSLWMNSRLDIAIDEIATRMETERQLLATAVQEALETKVSGEVVQIGQQGSWSDILTPTKTYRSKSGHWCRQYLRETMFGDHRLSIRGTACREQNGIWTTVLAEPASGSDVTGKGI